MTTSEPSLAVRIAEEAAKKGVGTLDAPVLEATWGPGTEPLPSCAVVKKVYLRGCYPFWRPSAGNIKLMGADGAGQHTKMCNQILIASTMIGVVESPALRS